MEFQTFVLAAATADLAAEPRARAHADAVEFRLDLADDPLGQLGSYDGGLPLIATNRVESEGGEVPEGPERRETLREAAAHPAVAAVDVELGALAEGPAHDVATAAREEGCAVVVSAHDFEQTPSPAAMADLLERAAGHGDVGKLAVTAQNRRDVLDLLAVTHERDAAGDRVATMAMGPAGRHSRAVAPVYGSRIGYAPVDPDDATAPGQYDLQTLAELVTSLGGR
ncbi:MAG: type I 3-dehydroquinate dehydratase [Halobacteriaceae archaeon]